MVEQREFDLVLWGATGFTGRLVAEYLIEHYGTESFRWALGGRNEGKLESVRSALGASALPLVLGDGDDEASMRALAARSRVVCSTVGPYALYGSKLVAACARGGTHYCDLTGEVHWMRRMIDAHQSEAAASGARIVHTCGFDCIPSDLGVFFVQREMRARHGAVSPHVRCRVAGFSGGASGGTIASMMNMFEEGSRDPQVRRVMNDPYAINPKGLRSGPDGPESFHPRYDEDFSQWTAPFVMAAVNTKVVRRSNALQGHAYGEEFRYGEAVLTGPGTVGFLKATGTAIGLVGGMAAAALGPVRRLLAKRLPSPGEGPSKAQREAGYWDLHFVGEHPSDPTKNVRARLTGDRDPGYGSTSKMLGESAVCLALDSLEAPGGFLTPAAAMGEVLISRLREKAGVGIEVEA